MKVLIPVDAAYAFDFHSILALKQTKELIGDDDVLDCREEIEKQIGERKFEEVLDSKEYLELRYANEMTFSCVDLAKQDSIKASKVDEWNTKRYFAKKALQEKFFGQAPLTEKKNI